MNNIEILYDDDGDDNDDETCRLKMTDLKIKKKLFFWYDENDGTYGRGATYRCRYFADKSTKVPYKTASR